MITDAKQLDWEAVKPAAERILKIARDIGFVPPEALDIHQMRIGEVCVAIGAIVQALQIKASLQTELVQVRNELIAAVPTENERHILRWLREQLQRADELVQGDIRYTAALELLQRLLTMKVNHAA